MLINFFTENTEILHEHIWYENHLLLAVYGWLVWNVLIFSLAKDKNDERGKRFNFKAYFVKHWDNMLVTAIITPVLVLFAPTLWMYLMGFVDKSYAFSDVAYMGVGVFVTFIYWIVRKFTR